MLSQNYTDHSAIMATHDSSFNAEFSFVWKIKNFSFCLPWTYVRSPTFIIQSMSYTRWCLHIWPKDYTNGIDMEYYLVREEFDPGPEFIEVAFELSFLDCGGAQLVKKRGEDTFEKDEFKGFSSFVEQAAVYTHRKHEFLPEDTLTACCKIRRIGTQTEDLSEILIRTQDLVTCSATSVVGVERSSFDWDIENFSIIRPGSKRTKRNPYIEVQFSLSAKPEEALQFEISHAHMEVPNNTDCEISVMNASKDVVYSKRDSIYLEGNVWEFPTFVKKSQLIAEKNVCLREDVLALKFNICISRGVISSAIDYYRSSISSPGDEVSSGDIQPSSNKDEALTSIEDNPPTANETEYLADHNIFYREKDDDFDLERKHSKETLEELSSKNSSLSMYESFSPTQNEECSSTEDGTEGELSEFDSENFIIEEILSTSSIKSELQCFYKDGVFSDINLLVGNETFPAHRLILSLRSLKFKEMLMSDLSKRSLKLTDLDVETLRDLLDFIYINDVENLTWEKAQKLYLAAESYQVTPLKYACLMFMKENISESNACNLLMLADEQQDEEVKELALEFIVKNGKAIMKTKAWEEMSKKHIKLAFETMQKMYLNKT